MLVIPSSLFFWDKTTGTLSADASDLEARYPVNRLEYQNGEWGFHIRSVKTSRRVWFKRMDEVKDADGELVSVHFKGTVNGRDLTCIVYND